MSDTAAILLEIEDGIAIMRLNRPEVRNAIDDAMRAEMMAAIDRISRDDGIRAVVVTGQGKGFCAGGDVKGMRARMEAPAGSVAINGWRRQQRTHHAIAMLHNLPKVTIAAVNGAATGLGCDLALCCDFVMASDAAMLTMSYIQRGLIPDGGGMYFLPRRVGLARAKELVFTGRRLTPAEALAINMIERVVPHDTLLEEAKAWAKELSAGSLAALALAKTTMNQSFETSMEDVFSLGSQAQAICYSTQEHRDSVTAFLAKLDRK